MHQAKLNSTFQPLTPMHKPANSAEIVDDSPPYLEALWSLMEFENLIDVIGAAMSGVGAVRAVSDLDPDLILMDVHMRPMSGPAAALVISEMYPRTKVILMSSEDSQQLRAECLSCGAHSFVSKANLMKELPVAIDQLGLRGSRATTH